MFPHGSQRFVEGWKSKIKVLAELGFGEGSLPPGLQEVCPYLVLSLGVLGEKNLWRFFLFF